MDLNNAQCGFSFCLFYKFKGRHWLSTMITRHEFEAPSPSHRILISLITCQISCVVYGNHPLQSPANAPGVTKFWKRCHSSGTCSFLNCSSFSSYFAKLIMLSLVHRRTCSKVRADDRQASELRTSQIFYTVCPPATWAAESHDLKLACASWFSMSMMMNMSVVFRGVKRVASWPARQSWAGACWPLALDPPMSWHHMFINTMQCMSDVHRQQRKQQDLLLEWCTVSSSPAPSHLYHPSPSPMCTDGSPPPTPTTLPASSGSTPWTHASISANLIFKRWFINVNFPLLCSAADPWWPPSETRDGNPPTSHSS